MGKLAELYKNSLNTAIRHQASVFDYGVDFHELWDEEDNGTPKVVSKLNGTQDRCIIVWDGGIRQLSPEGTESQLIRHLTPLDWALALSIKLLGQNQRPLPSMQIHIIDLTGERHTDKWAMRMRHQLLVEMPWVTRHAPLLPAKTAYRKGYDTILEDNGLLIRSGDGWEFNNDKSSGTPPSDVANRESVRGTLRDLAKQWSAILTQTGDHHDLNNIVGPSLIATLLGLQHSGERRSQELEAFAIRLLWSKFLDSSLPARKPEKDQIINTAGDIVVIDDQLPAGWDGILCWLFGMPTKKYNEQPGELSKLSENDSATLWGSTSGDALLEKLGITKTNASVSLALERYQARSWDSPVPREPHRPWMLVLDINLFMGEPSKETEWFSILAQAAQKLSQCSPLAWKGFSDSDLAEIADGDINEHNRDTALSLLPRLCALRWPSVPIILFSSTGRRELIAKLSDYANIFLASAKPNVLSGSFSENLSSFLASWRREFGYASSLIEVQRRLCRLQGHFKGGFFPRKENEHVHLVVALDETGDFHTRQKSHIGGVILFATGEDRDVAIQRSHDFQDAIRKNGINFYDHAPYYTDANSIGKRITNCLSKRGQDNASVINSELSAALGEHKGIKAATFCWTVPRQRSADTHDYADGIYLRGVSICIELIFAELLPSLGLTGNVTYSVWFPTKQTDYLNRFIDPEESEKIYDQKRNETNNAEAAETARRQYVEKMKTDHSNDAAELAKTEARRLDFRPTTPDAPSLVEAIGGWGAAYSQMLHALGHRSSCSSWFEKVCSLKTRKLPYSDNGHGKRESHNSKFDIHIPSQFRMAADYSVVAHLADVALGMVVKQMNSRTGVNVLSDCWSQQVSFHVYHGQKGLADFLHAARLIDDGRMVDGFKLAYEHEFFCNGLNHGSFAKAPITDRVIGQLQVHLKGISGNEIMALTGLRHRNILPDDRHSRNAASSQTESASRKPDRRRSGMSGQSDANSETARRSRDQTHTVAANPRDIPPGAGDAGGIIQLVLKEQRNQLDSDVGIVQSLLNQHASNISDPEYRKTSNGNPALRFTVSGNAKQVVKALQAHLGQAESFWKAVNELKS